MRKKIAGKKLNRTANERKQLLRQLMSQLVDKGVIVTTKTKAQFVKPNIEKLVTLAKNDSLTSFRRLIAAVGNVGTARKLTEFGKLFAARPGGYTRMLKLATTAGDNTAMVRLEWVEQLVDATPVVPVKAEKVAPVKEIKAATPKKRSTLIPKQTKSK